MSSKRAIRRKACEGKARHQDREGASVALRIAKREGRFGLEIYRCHFCRCYHLGHPTAVTKRARRNRRAA